MNEQKIQMVFFDAAGTLFDVRGSVGEIYARFAAQYGKQVAPVDLQQAFARQFPLQPPMAFAHTLGRTERLRCEQNWWRDLVRAVFARFGDFPQSEEFEEYFVEIFEFFRRAEAWEVFADVEPTLTALKARGLRLGIISNFDSRLYDVLGGLQLRAYFDSIHISTEVGAAKPDPAIFRAALDSHDLQPAQALHIGDSLSADVNGARSVGMPAIWLDRVSRERTRTNANESSHRLHRLTQMLTLREFMEIQVSTFVVENDQQYSPARIAGDGQER